MDLSGLYLVILCATKIVSLFVCASLSVYLSQMWSGRFEQTYYGSLES